MLMAGIIILLGMFLNNIFLTRYLQALKGRNNIAWGNALGAEIILI